MLTVTPANKGCRGIEFKIFCDFL